ncbi:glycoprotein precursor complex [Medjerda Valley virus]|uniref:Envelopment polyprotein n=1 Tax=Medjerda Valley virus TaxID=1775957 RepID=A0A0U4HUK5_9VIRU|nr:glycoprotein precursor complex [Medjerda Valley virus]ALX81177.1 glycoprotein precursor complex [Medjerda Valley virus]
MIVTTFLFLQCLVLVELRVSLTISSPEYSSQNCFNSAVDPKFLQRKWATEASKMGDFDYQCSYDTDTPVSSTKENAQGLLTFTVLSQYPSQFSCVDETRKMRISIQNNGEKEDGEAAYLDCEKNTLIHLISTAEPFPDHKLDAELAQEHENLKRRFKDLQTKFSSDRERLTEENERLKSELSSLHTTRELLKDQKAMQDRNLTMLNAVIHNLNKRVKEGESALSEALNQARRDKEALIFLEEDTDKKLENNESIIKSLQEELRKVSLPRIPLLPAVTTIATISLLSSSLVVADNRVHIDNRPGNGKYAPKNGNADTGCDIILYASKCKAWGLQKDSTKYPFFNAHYHKYSLIESMHATILAEKEKGICKVLNNSAQKYTECVKDLMPMKLSCPEGYKSAYYLNSKGMIAGIECDTNYQLSSDCKMCVKSSTVVKGVMPLQDVFCQKGAVDYTGPVMSLRGVCAIGSKQLRECKRVSTSYEKVPFITFDKKQKLYLDSLTLRNTESATPEHFICYELKGLMGSSDHNHGDASMKKVDPKDCKNVNESKNKLCTGDAVFCSIYQCFKDYPDTMCEVAPGSGIVEAYYGGIWTRPTCIGYENIMVTRESMKVSTPKETPCTACVWTCEKDGIRVVSHGYKMFSAVACAKGSCVSAHQEGSTEILVPYPGLSKMSGGKIGIHISHDDQSTSAHLIVRCHPKPACEVDGCILCFHGMINYQCHTAVSSLFISVLLIFLLLCCFWMLLKISKALKIAPSILRKPLLWVSLLVRWFVNLCKKCFRTRVEGINNAIGWNGEVRVVPQRRDNNRVRPVQYYLYANALLLLLAPLALCCTENVVASSKISRCSTQSGKSTCRLSGVITLKAGTIGSEACLTIKGPSDDQVAFLSIKTVASDLVCHEGDSYWTNHYTPKCLSSRRCHLVSECVGNACQLWNRSVVSKEFEHMTDNSLMTDNLCFEQCGAAGCSCFNINPSCLFVHSYLMPTRSEAVRVFECVSWSHRLVLEVSGPKVNTRRITLSALSTQIAEWGSITLNIDSEVMNLGTPISFMRTSSGAMAIVDESFSRSPRKGYLGEVRCNSESHAARGDNSCLRAPDLIKYRPQLDSVECTSSLVDPYAILLRSSLPQKRGNHIFTQSIDGTSVQAMTSGAINAEFSLLLDNYEVDFISNTVTCDAAFVNITGCYSCNEGAEVCVKVVSTGSGSFFAISDESSQAIQFQVQQGESLRCRILHFSRPEVEEQFSYSCGGDRKPLIVRGTLIAVGPHDDRVAGGKSIVVNPKKGTWSIGGWFSGLVSWLGGPLRTAGMVVLYIVISIVVIIIVWALLKVVLTRALLARRKMV